MSTNNGKTIDLAAAFQPIPPVKLRNGKTVQVRPLNGHDLPCREALASDPRNPERWYDLAVRVLSAELTPEEVRELSEAEVTIIATLATEKYDTVAEMIDEQGKAWALVAGVTATETGATPESAPSPSTPATPSATSAPA